MSVALDETLPLLRSKSNTSTTSSHSGARAGHQYTEVNNTTDSDSETTNDTCIFDFDPLGDVDNPLEWPTPFKWGIVLLLALTAFTVTFTCIGVIPLASDIGRDLSGPDRQSSKSSSVLMVTIWELGEAAGPVLIAPLSEMYGRYPVINGANILFILATVLAATSTSISTFISARALTGLAVASNVLNPAIVGDMFVSEQRGGAVSLIFLAPLIGGALGPAIASAVAQQAGWRRVVWMSVALASICELLFLTLFKETYKVAILRERAKKMGVKASLEGAAEEPDSKGIRGLRDAVLRPAIVLFGSGVLMAMSFYGAVVFSHYYLVSVTMPFILSDVYQLEPVAAGLCFMSFSIGSTVSVFICNRNLDGIYVKMRDANKGVGKPEYRLPLAIVGSLTMPLAIASYGWCAELHLGLSMLLLSVIAFGMTLTLILVPLMSYVVDAFGLFSASAMTGVIVTRCLMSTFLPLTTGPLVESVGYGWAFTLFALFSLSLAPIPMLMFRYGSWWRRLSKYSRDQ